MKDTLPLTAGALGRLAAHHSRMQIPPKVAYIDIDYQEQLLELQGTAQVRGQEVEIRVWASWTTIGIGGDGSFHRRRRREAQPAGRNVPVERRIDKYAASNPRDDQIGVSVIIHIVCGPGVEDLLVNDQ